MVFHNLAHFHFHKLDNSFSIRLLVNFTRFHSIGIKGEYHIEVLARNAKDLRNNGSHDNKYTPIALHTFTIV